MSVTHTAYAECAMSSTDMGCTGIVLRARYAVSGTDLGYAPTRTSSEQGFSTRYKRAAIRLRASYALSGTNIAYAPSTRLCAPYAMSGTDLVYAATRPYWSCLLYTSDAADDM
eukprot:3695311-Rhodomonas_salina.1